MNPNEEYWEFFEQHWPHLIDEAKDYYNRTNNFVQETKDMIFKSKESKLTKSLINNLNYIINLETSSYNNTNLFIQTNEYFFNNVSNLIFEMQEQYSFYTNELNQLKIQINTFIYQLSSEPSLLLLLFNYLIEQLEKCIALINLKLEQQIDLLPLLNNLEKKINYLLKKVEYTQTNQDKKKMIIAWRDNIEAITLIAEEFNNHKDLPNLKETLLSFFKESKYLVETITWNSRKLSKI